MIRIVSPLLGTVASVRVVVGDTVAIGEELCVIESMKMEHAVCAEQAFVVRGVAVAAGDKVESGAVLVEGEVVDAGRAGAKVDASGGVSDGTSDSSRLAVLRERKHKLTDDARQAATQKRHTRGMRTVRMPREWRFCAAAGRASSVSFCLRSRSAASRDASRALVTSACFALSRPESAASASTSSWPFSTLSPAATATLRTTRSCSAHTACSIFIDSITHNSSPAATVSPTLTRTDTTVPRSGETMRITWAR